MPTEQEYSLTELATLSGVTPRTIRYYISLGLLPSPAQAGPGTRYGDGHLLRIRLIRTLQADHLPLAEIRGRMEALDDSAVEAALAEAGSAPAGSAPAGSALDYIRALRVAPGSTAQTDVSSSPSIPVPMSAPGSTPSPPGAVDPMGPERSQWERVAFGSNVELHIRRPLSRLENKRVERLIVIARELLEEDQP
ncbi:hypothetical protein BH23CHL8_BH23CHL8_12800 [soil metagenome]